MTKYLIGWSFDQHTPKEHWCDTRTVTAEDPRTACSIYINHNNTVSTNPLVVLHVKEFTHVNYH